jgi:hypothetical protein
MRKRTRRFSRGAISALGLKTKPALSLVLCARLRALNIAERFDSSVVQP